MLWGLLIFSKALHRRFFKHIFVKIEFLCPPLAKSLLKLKYFFLARPYLHHVSILDYQIWKKNNR